MAKGWEHWDEWSAWLKQAMAQRGWPAETTGSQRRLAEEGDITPSAISGWLDPRGPRSQPSTENCQKLADAFDMTVLEVYVAAHYLTPEQARQRPPAPQSLSGFTMAQLLVEVGERYREAQNEIDDLKDGLKKARPGQPETPVSRPRRTAKQPAGR